ncbi:MAG: thiol-disulfide isomerase or thioredoxin [Bacteroidota bacterium]|nr:thiol-disulfide isomerase or thioredoxin [Bacteroidota bacterium]
MKKLWFTLLALVVTTAIFAEEGYKPGSTATDFKLKNVDGKTISLSDYQAAKGFIVTFTCNHCPYAVAYEDRIIALDKKYADKGYPVIAINPNSVAKVPEDSYANMQDRAKSKSFPFPYLYDETQEIAKIYGAMKTPHVYVLKKEGKKLSVKYIGAIDDNYEDVSAVKEKYVEEAVDALLANKPVKTTSTKAIGCSIKWK